MNKLSFAVDLTCWVLLVTAIWVFNIIAIKIAITCLVVEAFFVRGLLHKIVKGIS